MLLSALKGLNREAALSMTLQRTKRWHYLLQGGKTGGLTVEEQRGLVGELAFLRDLVTELGPRTAIEAWTGPSGSAKDFELINSCIEVKGHRAAANPSISISSENQLADVEGARVFEDFKHCFCSASRWRKLTRSRQKNSKTF